MTIAYVALGLAVLAVVEATYLIFALNHLADRSLAMGQRLQKRIDAVANPGGDLR